MGTFFSFTPSVYYWPDGKQFYEGQWRLNRMDGKGVLTCIDGKKYTGDYVDDKKHGQGCFEWRICNPQKQRQLTAASTWAPGSTANSTASGSTPISRASCGTASGSRVNASAGWTIRVTIRVARRTNKSFDIKL
jgi:hypothetical protein